MAMAGRTSSLATAIIGCAILALTAGSAGGRPKASLAQAERAEAPDPVDEGLMSSEFPMILFSNGLDRSANSDWMAFETDPCGLLRRVENSRSMLRQSGLNDDLFDPAPSDEGRALIDRWLSEHADVAVINDEIDKSCGNDWLDGEEFAPEFLARGVNDHRVHRLWQESASDIA